MWNDGGWGRSAISDFTLPGTHSTHPVAGGFARSSSPAPVGRPQPGDSEAKVDPFPLLQLEMGAGLALRCQLLGQLAPEGVAVETQTDVLLNS